MATYPPTFDHLSTCDQYNISPSTYAMKLKQVDNPTNQYVLRLTSTLNYLQTSMATYPPTFDHMCTCGQYNISPSTCAMKEK